MCLLSGHHEKIPVFPVTGVRITGAFKTKERRVTHQLLLSFSVSGKVFAHEFLVGCFFSYKGEVVRNYKLP